jgi:hypothetical protein
MAERDFQAALLHLYRTAEVPAFLALSTCERSWLEELVASQRDRLRFVGERLRAKRQRFVRHALPSSRQAFPEWFESLLQDWSQASPLESGIDGPDALRDFARHVAVRHRPDATKALAFVRFDAACAAVSLSVRQRDRLDTLSPGLQLGLEDDADLIGCDFNPLALQDPALLKEAEPLSAPQHALLFREQSGSVRSLALSPGLAAVLGRFRGGACLHQVLAQLPSDAARDALSHSLSELLRLGVPFFLLRPANAP